LLTPSTEKVAASKPTLTVEEAIAAAEKTLGGKFNDHPATLEYVVKADNTAVLTHVVQIQNDETGAWVEAFVDAHTGEIVTITDFVAKASVSDTRSSFSGTFAYSHIKYRVLPLQKEVLTDGFETVTDPQDTTASPQGWHSDGTTSTTTTA